MSTICPQEDKQPRFLPVSGWDPDSAAVIGQKLGLEPYRITQILEWVFQRGILSWQDMTNLSKPLRERMHQAAPLTSSRLEKVYQDNGHTRKITLRVNTGDLVEAVLIPDKDRYTACVSTQLGCLAGCVFCASGIGRFRRNLRQEEITDQVLWLRSLLEDHQRLTHVVFMGMGEPLANLDAVQAVMKMLCADWGMGMSARRLTISTVGLLKGIEQMMHLPCKANLAVSLHAPNQEIRQMLVPTSQPGDFARLLQTAWDYQKASRRRLTFEYVLLEDVNDQPAHATELAGLLGAMPCRINLIPYNPIPQSIYKRPSDESVDRFRSILVNKGLRVTVRMQKGAGISAACGQLALQDANRHTQ